MAEDKLPHVPEYEVLPPDWETLTPTQFRVKIVSIDDLGFPFDPRGVTVTIPHRAHHKNFAAQIGKQVENTILLALGYEIEEEKNG